MRWPRIWLFLLLLLSLLPRNAAAQVTTSTFDVSRGTRSMVFGGNRSMPRESRSRDLQLSDDISFLLTVGRQLHRLKAGGSLQRSLDANR